MMCKAYCARESMNGYKKRHTPYLYLISAAFGALVLVARCLHYHAQLVGNRSLAVHHC
jgi:hypothetical protein